MNIDNVKVTTYYAYPCLYVFRDMLNTSVYASPITKDDVMF